jgi:hypothetical protein
VAGSQDFGEIQLQSAKVTEGVYVLYGAGGKIGVSAGAGGVLLIDRQFRQLHEKPWSYCKETVTVVLSRSEQWGDGAC